MESQACFVQVWSSDKRQRGCRALIGCEAAENTAFSPFTCILICLKTDIFSASWRVCLHVFACVCVGALLLCSLHVCRKWKVNFEAVGLDLPPFLSPAATLTVQSQDNGGETNSVFRQSNPPPPWCVYVCVCLWGQKKKVWHSVKLCFKVSACAAVCE